MSILDKNQERQKKYWEDRAERSVKAADKSAKEVTDGLINAWEDTYANLVAEIEAFYGRYAKEEKVSVEEIQARLSPSELRSAKEDIAKYYAETERLGLDLKYKKYLRSLSARAYMSRLEELKLNVRHEIEKLAGKQQEAFEPALMESYEDTYYHSVFDIQQGIGMGGSFTALNTEVVEKAVREKWIGENYSDDIWKNKDKLVSSLETIIPRSMASGQNPRVIAKQIKDRLGVNKSDAERLARTEFIHIANEATFQSYKECGVAEYQFLATFEINTCKYCRALDLMHFKLSEKIVGVNFPTIHPRCRCTTIAYFEPDEIDAMFERSTRLARDPETGKNYYVPGNITFEEWRKGLTEEDGKYKYDSSKPRVPLMRPKGR